jgi:hypothetical protein
MRLQQEKGLRIEAGESVRVESGGTYRSGLLQSGGVSEEKQ